MLGTQERGLIVLPREVEEEALPIPVAPDWDERLRQATAMAKLIDQHLDHEERGRRLLPDERLMPIALCPEQRVNMITDARAVTT
jgi:hypothetical protein